MKLHRFRTAISLLAAVACAALSVSPAFAAALDRSHLKSAPTYNEEFLTAATPGKFAEYPRPDGARLRTKFEFGGTSNSARGLGLNQNGATSTAESEFYSNYGLVLSGVTLRSPYTQNANDTFTITAMPLLAAEKTAIQAQPNGTLLNTPTHLSGMLATEFHEVGGLWEARFKRTEAVGDFDAFWLSGPPSSATNEYDFEFVAADPGFVYMTGHVGQDSYYATKPGGPTVSQSKVAIDSTVFHTYQILETKTQVVWAIDDVVVKTLAVDSNLLPKQAIINKAKNGGWNTTYNPPSIATGTETSDMTIDFIRWTPGK